MFLVISNSVPCAQYEYTEGLWEAHVTSPIRTGPTEWRENKAVRSSELTGLLGTSLPASGCTRGSTPLPVKEHLWLLPFLAPTAYLGAQEPPCLPSPQHMWGRPGFSQLGGYPGFLGRLQGEASVFPPSCMARVWQLLGSHVISLTWARFSLTCASPCLVLIYEDSSQQVQGPG